MANTKRLLFLGRRDDRAEYDTAASMRRLLETRPSSIVTYESSDFEDLLFEFDGTDLRITDVVKGYDIREFDGVFLVGWFKTKQLEDVALSVAQYLLFHNVKVLNSEAASTRSRAKLSQYVIAALHGVSMTPFLFSLDSQHLLSHDVTLPVIAKSISAARGNDNYLVHTSSELREIMTGSSDVHFVLQGYVPNDGDFRIIVAGGQVRLAIYRQAQGETHLNNTSKGGVSSLVPIDELDEKLCQDAILLAKLLRREVTGVDMIIHRETGQHYLLEINNMPQLSTGSQLSHKAALLADFFEEWL